VNPVEGPSMRPKQHYSPEYEKIWRQLLRSQQDFLHKVPSAPPGYEFAVRLRPGYDFPLSNLYDVLPLADGRYLIAVGHAGGRVLAPNPPILRMFKEIREEHSRRFQPATVAKQALRHVSEPNFVMLFLGLFDPKNHALSYLTAGYEAFAVVDHRGHLNRFEVDNPPIGFLKDFRLHESQLEFAPGDCLCVWTSGLSGVPLAGEQLPPGEPHPVELLHKLPQTSVDDTLQRIFAETETLRATDHIDVDSTLFLLRRKKDASPAR
jgi:serine phosphatase RsbU (regulator of sigma subunit)